MFSVIGLLPLISLIDTSLMWGSSPDARLRWEALIRSMETVLILFQNGAVVIVLCWVTVLLPMYTVRRMRPLVASALIGSSVLMGVMCWWHSIIVTYRLLGWACVCVGVLCGGIGVVPMAIYAAVTRSDGVIFVNLTMALVLTLIPRFIARSIKIRLAMRREAARTKEGYWTVGEQHNDL